MSKGKSQYIPNVFDEYTFKARYVPAIILSVPIMLLSSLIGADELNSLFRYADKFLIVSKVGLNVIFIVFFTHVVRTMGKYLIEYFLFDNGLKFPTTEMLLWQTALISKEKKANLHKKIREFPSGNPDFDASGRIGGRGHPPLLTIRHRI